MTGMPTCKWNLVQSMAWPVCGLLVVLLSGCGAAYHAQRGQELLDQGQFDEAIAAYETAAQASKSDREDKLKYRGALRRARTRAALHHVRIGDKARERRQLASAATSYRTARKYAPTHSTVVRSLADLMNLRMKTEAAVKGAREELQALSAAKVDKESIVRWLQLIQTLDGLQVWRAQYPEVDQLKRSLNEPASNAMVKHAQVLVSEGKSDEAAMHIGMALRLTPGNQAAKSLQTEILQRGNADRLARLGRSHLKRADATKAAAKFTEALEADPDHAEAKKGLATAQKQVVQQRLSATKTLVKSKDHRNALVAIREAHDTSKKAGQPDKKLSKLYKKLHKRASAQLYKRGRKQAKKRHHGAALISFRLVQALGGKQRDLGRRISKLTDKLLSSTRYKLLVTAPKGPAAGYVQSTGVLASELQRRLAGAGLTQAGVALVHGKRARKQANGSMNVRIDTFDLNRTTRPDKRRKSFLDRVEFPANPKWAEAQELQTLALAELNHCTDVMRPLQAEMDGAESKLAELQEKAIEVNNKIIADNKRYYADPKRKRPCPDGSTRCPQSYGHKRWAKHVKHYAALVATTDATIKKLAPDFQAAQDAMHKAQEGFESAEVTARDTSKTLRQEIWLDHEYNVTLHELKIVTSLTVAWSDRLVKKEIVTTSKKIDEDRVDFSTPQVVIKKQTLEQAKKSKLPIDETVAAELVTRLLDAVMGDVLKALTHHGQRYIEKAKATKGGAQLHWQVMALASGKALAAETQQALVQTVLDQTGYNWADGSIDFAKIPLK